ncbi:carbohydrate ABC transporter permease [Microbacterium sp. NPDC058342]|uniref:carbohydrate ABC transporter permease n=1 Tax=Microbacterium sp. NPDC058342 TaxID=3346454 RepID=UPI0036675E20
MSLIALSVVFLGPIWWMLTGSVKSDAEILSYPPTLFPREFQWSNYAAVFELQPFARQFFNSVFVMALVCVLTVIVSTCAGYAFARVKPVGSSILFLVLLSATFIPPEATIVPLFRLVGWLNWIDTYYPLVIITVFLHSAPIATFILRQAYLGLPKELGESARLDGASDLRIFLTIYTPLVRPSLAAVMVLAGWHSWSQYLEPLIYLRSTEMFTVPLALTQFYDPFAGPLWSVQMAATTLSVLPVLALFLFAQRHVISGLTAGAVKS